MHRPRVIANFARTADGKTSTHAKTPSGFTSQRDLRRLLEIRAMGDAVLAGRATIAADQMSMTLRDDDLRDAREAAGQPREPLRVILSGSGSVDPDWPVFRTPGADRLVFTTHAMPDAIREKITPLAHLHTSETDRVDLREMLRTLYDAYAVRTLVCEGGGTLFRSLLEIDAIDSVFITFAPVIFGGADASTLTGISPDFLPTPVRFSLASMEVVENECFCRYDRADPC